MRMKRGLRIALAAISWLAILSGAQSALAANNTLHYYGGPVSHSMNVVLVEWGSTVRSTYTDATTGDPAFFTYLAGQSGSTTDIGGVLAQYMDTSGKNSQNAYSYKEMDQITPPASGGPTGCKLPSCVDDTVIQSQLHSNINSAVLPSPSGNGLSTIYVVLFPPNVDVCQGGTCAYSSKGFCAYHGSFPLNGSTHALYAAMVDNGPTTPNSGLCGPSTDDLANQTDVLSHEYAETINDPLVAEAASFGPPLAWYNSSGGEIGDICVGANEQAPNGPWTVQKIWSNLDNNCVVGESAYSAPTASFLAPSVAALTQSTTFDASSSSDPSSDQTFPMTYSGTSYSVPSGIATYQWNWGDGSPVTTSSSPTASHAYAADGNYNVSLTVTDQLGFISTVTKQISITDAGAPIGVQTLGASNITDSSATLNGTVDPASQNGTFQFIFGTAPNALNHATPSQPLPTSAAPVSADLSGLSAGTTYYYELQSTTGNQTYSGQVVSFTTIGPPAVTTGSVSKIKSTTAVVAGTVDPNGSATTYHVEYGTSTSYGHSTVPASAGSGTSNVAVSVALGGLKAKTTYHYRLVATSAGGTTVGSDRTFMTAKALAAAPKFSFKLLAKPTLSAALAHGLRVRFRCSKACTARFTMLVVPTNSVLEFTSSLLTAGRGHRKIRSAGAGTAVITFIPKIRGRLKGQPSLKILISGYASSPRSNVSPPRSIRIKLR
jgi:hypothetical protein